ncbi:MAG: response regulator [Pseudomonadales bacterium]|nr:response regulator [Pseudomonadales bacterium]
MTRTAFDPSSAHYRNASLRAVVFTLPIYLIFFLSILLVAYAGLTAFSAPVFLISVLHILTLEALIVAAALFKRRFSRKQSIQSIWLLVGNNIIFFCYWLFHLGEFRDVMYLIAITSTIGLFTIANFWQAIAYNMVLVLAMLITAWLASLNNPAIVLVNDALHALMFLFLSFWLSLLAHTFTQQRKQLGQAVSKLKQNEEHLIQESQAKSQFLAMMSHEIRTPLNGMIGMLDLLKQQIPHNDFLQVAQNSSRALLAVLNDVLDFSKIEAAQLQLEQIPFAIDKVLDECVETMLFTAEEKGLTLSLQSSSQQAAPATLLGDPHRLRQIVMNLLSNAIKFTPSGFVQLRYQLDQQADQWQLNLSVVDSGIGIANEQIDMLFQAFKQADSSTAREYGGTGLGLAISYQLAQMMGGQLSVQSALGQGSSFTLQLPLGTPVSPLEHAELSATETLSLQQVAVVDDNQVNLLTISAMLDQLSIAYQAFQSGAEFLQAYQAGQLFDLVFMDCEMPTLNGYDTVRQLRQLEQQSRLPKLTIVALTANTVKQALDACYEAGMNDILIKPLELEQLRQCLAKYNGQRQPLDSPKA